MKQERLHYLDWLRIGAFGLLILFHCMRFFDFFPWHIKNAEQSEFATQIFLFTTSWRMPLIFFVSGAGTYFAMRSKKEKFISDRIKRLLIPFVFGILILIPPQKFLEYIFYNDVELSYFSFLQIYPSQLLAANNGLNLTWFGLIGYHIWYLPYLFVQTLLLFPAFKYLKNLEGQQNKFLALSGNVWVLFAAVIIINATLRPFFPQYLNWADFFHFLLFFYFGFYFVCYRETLEEKLSKYQPLFITLALITSLLTHYFALFTPYMIKWVDTPDLSLDYIGFWVIRSINALSWVLLLLNLFVKYIDKKHAWLKPLNESILPVYLLHQTFIVIVGYYIVQLEIGIIPKFLIILGTISLMIYLTYGIIKRINALRFLFGMKKLSAQIQNDKVQRSNIT